MGAGMGIRFLVTDKHGRQDQKQGQGGDGQQELNKPADDIIDCPAIKSRISPNSHPDDRSNHDRKNSDRERDAPCMD